MTLCLRSFEAQRFYVTSFTTSIKLPLCHSLLLPVILFSSEISKKEFKLYIISGIRGHNL